MGQRPFWWRRSITISMASLTRLSGRHARSCSICEPCCYTVTSGCACAYACRTRCRPSLWRMVYGAVPLNHGRGCRSGRVQGRGRASHRCARGCHRPRGRRDSLQAGARDLWWHRRSCPCCRKEPMRGRSAIFDYWAHVTETERNIQFGHEILAVTEESGIARWWATFLIVPQGLQTKLDGIFVINLDGDGRCTALREWWHKEQK